MGGTGSKRELPRQADGFELLSELGSGGMGVVYRARELSTGRVVALKVLRHSSDEDDTTFDRFQREAMIAGSISDSRCVFVYGAHSVEGAPAIAMELVEGETLEAVLARKEPIAVRRAVQWGIELCEALEVAHRAGILHRDVKPSNCFLDPEGRVKLGDFGLSRSIESNVHLTDKGAFIGSPLYAPPEQIRGRDVDERSDLYSAAATIYALLAGRPGWTGNNIQEVFARILSEPPEDLATLRSEIPRELAEVVARAMDKDPARRFESVRALREALHPFASEAPAADLWRRGAAYAIDSLGIGVIAALLAVLVEGRSRADLSEGPLARAIEYAAVLLTLLYFTLCEGRFGRSLGKWALGLKVERADGSALGYARALVRAAMLSVGTVLSLAFSSEVEQQIGDGVMFSYVSAPLDVLWFAAMALTMRRVSGKRGVHELVSGTRTTQSTLPLQRISTELRVPEPRALDANVEGDGILDRYRLRGCVAQTSWGPLYMGEDALLEREVWILAEPRDATEMIRAERSARLRWLASFEAVNRRWLVLEAPGGETFERWRAAQGELAWDVVLRLLRDLSIELELSGSRAVAPEQLWIDRSHNLRVLDFTVLPATAQAQEPRALLEWFLRRLLGVALELPHDMPGAADEVIRRVLARQHASISEARRELESLASAGKVLARRQRVFHSTFSAFVGASFVVGCAMGVVLAYSQQGISSEQLAPGFSNMLLIVSAMSLAYISLTRGGISFRMFGLLLRDARGRRASRWTWFQRAVLLLGPLLLAAVTLRFLATQREMWICAGVTGALYLAGLVYTLMQPQVGLIDRVLRTRIVGR